MMNDRASSVVVDVEELNAQLIRFVERQWRIHLETAAAVEHTLNRVLEPFDPAGLKWEDPLREQMRRDLPPIPGRVSAHVAYIVAADRDDPDGQSFNDGDYYMFIDVTDENIQSDENGNPVITLRMRYDAWKAQSG